MKNLHTRFSGRYLVLTSLVSISIIYFFCYSFSGCSTEPDNGMDADQCVVSDFVITLSPGNVTLAPGSSQAIHITAVVSSECEDLATSLNVSLAGEVPLGISLSGCGNASMNSNRGSCDATLTVSPQAESGSYQIELLATASLVGGRTSVDTKTLSVTVDAPPDFSLSISHSFGAGQGMSITIAATVNRSNAHTNDINLSLDYVPPHVTYSFQPNPVTINDQTSQLTISPALSSPHGSYSVWLKGEDGNIEKHRDFDFHILEPFHPVMMPDSITIAQGQSETVTVKAGRLSIFFEPVFYGAEGAIIGQGNNLIEPVDRKSVV